MKTLSALFLALFMLPASAWARTLFYHVYGCAGGATASSWGFIDDATGSSYMMVRGCDGTHCIYPLYGPFQARVPTAWTTPVPSATWHEMTEAARLVTEPGAYVGLWLLTDAGDTIRFRNPVNDAERVRYIAMYEAEHGAHEGSTLSEREMTELAVNDMIADYRNQVQTADNQMTNRLVAQYQRKRFGDRLPATAAERQELTNVAAHLALTHQTLVIGESPSPSNGQRLVIAPLVPAFAGTVRIINSGGTPVWEGSVTDATTVSGNDWPTGTYFIQGEGKPIAVNIVR